ncbi:MAG: sugar phosphate isomerase/epimerase [Victivallales bacterium]|nr:sugar phosphate isomerase/epimerase [Victivallales bacterium]
MMNVKLPDVSYNFGADATAEMIPERVANLASYGVRRVMLDASQLMKAADDLAYLHAMQNALKNNGLVVYDAHAPHGPHDSFGFPAPEAEHLCLEKAHKAMVVAAELGAKTVTFHVDRTRRVGNMVDEFGVFEKVELEKARSRILHQLEIVLPEAQRLGLMIALENLFLPSSTAEFLASIMRGMPHPNLGLNYDSGHALLLERQPGKKSEDIAEWIRIGWDDDCVIFQDDQLDAMLPYVITCHIHDNRGKDDEHLLPGQGIADWKRIVERLCLAPRLLSIQSEVKAKCYGDDPGSQTTAFRACGFK